MWTREKADRLKSDFEAMWCAANENLEHLAFCEQQRSQIEALEKENDILRKKLKENGIHDELF